MPSSRETGENQQDRSGHHPCGAHMVRPKELPHSQRHHACLWHSTWNKAEQNSTAPHTKPALTMWKQEVGGTLLRDHGIQTCISADNYNEAQEGRVSRCLTSGVRQKDPWFFPKNQKRIQPVHSWVPKCLRSGEMCCSGPPWWAIKSSQLMRKTTTQAVLREYFRWSISKKTEASLC